MVSSPVSRREPYGDPQSWARSEKGHESCDVMTQHDRTITRFMFQYGSVWPCKSCPSAVSRAAVQPCGRAQPSLVNTLGWCPVRVPHVICDVPLARWCASHYWWSIWLAEQNLDFHAQQYIKTRVPSQGDCAGAPAPVLLRFGWQTDRKRCCQTQGAFPFAVPCVFLCIRPRAVRSKPWLSLL